KAAGDRTTSPPAIVTAHSAARPSAPRISSSAPAASSEPPTPSARYASPPATPIAARSDRAPASARWPASAALIQSRRKCTPSTIASVDTTAPPPPARTPAASSPTQRATRPPRAVSPAAIASIRARSFSAQRSPGLAVAVDDPRAIEVIRRELAAHAIARKDPDAKAAHLARDVPQDDVVVVELDAEHRVRQRLDHLALELDLVFLSHCLILASGPWGRCWRHRSSAHGIGVVAGAGRAGPRELVWRRGGRRRGPTRGGGVRRGRRGRGR